ncbi:Type I inositol 1; 4; 5-trisphosphate 5-phosphatase [Camelus dromedarius]|uniref:inositol-polyphosphate 5-phosphatase n=1 Tax=Camelus dromedarius TaxID=9838 RepID=A0A5N4DK10_CAMDR|nr:Type I inositol 1; 4; 5-trisphosphate 5-phosphatase [Camelus dromedarius]
MPLLRSRLLVETSRLLSVARDRVGGGESADSCHVQLLCWDSEVTRPSSGSVFTEPLQSPAPKADGAAGVAVHPSGDSGEAETICRQLEGPGDARAGGTGASGRVPTVFPGNTVGTQHPSPSPGGLALWWELRPSSPALGSFYFLHESLKNIYQFDFKGKTPCCGLSWLKGLWRWVTGFFHSFLAKKYKKVTGKEIYSDTLESTPMLEKEKFPQDYFPECKWSRKGFIRTRWCVADCAFDLVNIHLFHDASNLVAWETSPSVYSGIRRKALGYVLDRISDQRFEKASYFVFGDFNFRLDSKSVVETNS